MLRDGQQTIRSPCTYSPGVYGVDDIVRAVSNPEGQIADLHFGKREGDYWPVSVDHEKGWAVTRVCGDRDQSLFVMWWSVPATATQFADDGREVLGRVRCLRADEPLT